MNKYIVLLIEAIVVGIITVVVGTLSAKILSAYATSSNELPEVCKSWNKNYVMEKSLFLTGFLTHILCQITGINKWYCSNGLACVDK